MESLEPTLPLYTETPQLRLAPRFNLFIHTHRISVLVLAGVLAAFSAVLVDRYLTKPPLVITQRDIDRAVRTSIEEKPLPSRAAKAYEMILPSVVRVDGFDHLEGVGNLPKRATPEDDKGKKETGGKDHKDDSASKRQSIGTGVVITERGSILNNLHAVVGTSRIQVVFADGTESEAVVNFHHHLHGAVTSARGPRHRTLGCVLRGSEPLATVRGARGAAGPTDIRAHCTKYEPNPAPDAAPFNPCFMRHGSRDAQWCN